MILKWSLFLLFAPVAVSAADAAENRVTWSEFSTRMTPKCTIRMVLPDGTHIEGRPLQVKPDAIDVRISRTSNKQAHRKGDAAIPRESVSVVEVRNPRWKGKLIGTLAPIGVGAAILAAGVAANQGSDDVYGYAILGGATMGFGAPLGFFVGRAIDRRFEQFIIIPERQSAKP